MAPSIRDRTPGPSRSGGSYTPPVSTLPQDVRYDPDQSPICPAGPRQIWEPLKAFDNSGQELGEHARVWKLYIQEAYRMDSEHVDGWNRMVDVVMIFASLFSAVITPFVIETSNRLRMDPENPSITRAAVVVNALWFLSLILSVATSFFAMLSKEWFFRFTSNRFGSPMEQALRRQQRWDKVLKWRMPQLLALLPAIIHNSLVLYSVGLVIFLWDLGSLVVAIPVTIIVILMVLLCIAFTIMPLVDKYCPYSTSTSIAYFAIRGIDPQPMPEGPRKGIVIVRVLHSMITSGNPEAMDLALQALSAAKEAKLPLALLEECDTWFLIWSRFNALHPFELHFDATPSLYAQAFLALEALDYDTKDRRNICPDRICLLLWATQGYSRRGNYNRSRDSSIKQEVLQFGRVVVHHCLRIMKSNTPGGQFRGEDFESSESFGLSNHVIGLLERPDLRGDPGVYGGICTSFTALLCCSLLYWPHAMATSFIMRFIRAHCSNPTPEFALILGAFAFSRYDYPIAGASSHTSAHTKRAERALNVFWHYVSGTMDYPAELAVLGLRYLQAHERLYHLTEDDTREISQVLGRYSRLTGEPGTTTVIYTLPESFDVHSFRYI